MFLKGFRFQKIPQPRQPGPAALEGDAFEWRRDWFYEGGIVVDTPVEGGGRLEFRIGRGMDDKPQLLRGGGPL